MWQEALFLAHETEQRFLCWQLHVELAHIAPNPNLCTVHLNMAREIINQIATPIEDEELRRSFLQAPLVQAVFN